MQNFLEIGRVVFAGEYVSMKIGCASYDTSKPVKDRVASFFSVDMVVVSAIKENILFQL